MDKRLLAITVTLMASVTLCFGAGSPYITWFKGVGTNTYLTNASIRTPLFGLNTNLGTTEATVVLNGTNKYTNPLNKHISITASSVIATSSDGAFGVLTASTAAGVDLEMSAPNGQYSIIEVIDANTCIIGEVNGGALQIPQNSWVNVTTWEFRPNVLRTTDNTVGLENFGTKVNCDGMIWQYSVSACNPCIVISGFRGDPTVTYGGMKAATVGLNGQENQGWGVSALRTNAGDWPAGRLSQIYISPNAAAETMVFSGGAASGQNTEIAIQGPIVNRHGTTVPFVPCPIFTNGVSSQLSNKLALVVIGTNIAATNGGFNWQNITGRNITVFINNAGVTASSFSINGTQIYTSANGNWTIPLQDQEAFSFLYSVGTPTIKYKPF